MPIRFVCPACGQRYQVENSAAGKHAACKKCGETVRVPQYDDAEPVELQEIADAPIPKAQHLANRAKGSNYSAAAFWCGIASTFCFAPLGVLALIFGIIALASGNETGKRSDAIAGICFGAFGWIVWVVIWNLLVLRLS